MCCCKLMVSDMCLGKILQKKRPNYYCDATNNNSKSVYKFKYETFS